MRAYSFAKRSEAEILYVIEGKTLKEVSEMTGVSFRTIQNWSSNAQWKKRQLAYQEAMRELKINEALAENLAFKKVIEALGSQEVETRMHLKEGPKALKSIQLHIYF